MNQNVINIKTHSVDEFAKADKQTIDVRYNEGLRPIRSFGYEYMCSNDSVKYYCSCNNL